MKTSAAFLLAAVLSAGCVYTPQVVTRYDDDCGIEFREMKLTEHQMQDLSTPGRCSGEASCLSLIAARVLLTPASAIVSGSIVLVGNTVFWMEKRGRCVQYGQPGASAEVHAAA